MIPKLSEADVKTLQPFNHMYQMCILKHGCEAVVEGMCGIIDKHAVGERGLAIEHYGWEGIVHYNLPGQGNCTRLLRAGLKQYEKNTQKEGGPGLRFVSTDKRQRWLKPKDSCVLDRIDGIEARLSFMGDEK